MLTSNNVEIMNPKVDKPSLEYSNTLPETIYINKEEFAGSEIIKKSEDESIMLMYHDKHGFWYDYNFNKKSP